LKPSAVSNYAAQARWFFSLRHLAKWFYQHAASLIGAAVTPQVHTAKNLLVSRFPVASAIDKMADLARCG
jgi:hypothetical protein